MPRIRVSVANQPPTTVRRARQITKAIDVFTGYVREIIDSCTIDLNLVAPTTEQLKRYQVSELVRLVGAQLEGNEHDVAELRLRLHHKQVRCFVHGRDDEGRVLAVAIPLSS